MNQNLLLFLFFSVTLLMPYLSNAQAVDTLELAKEYQSLIVTADSLEERGENFKALNVYNKAFETYEKLDSPFTITYLIKLNSNAIANSSIGNLNLASDRYETILNGIETIYGKNNLSYVDVSVNLCRNMNETGDYMTTMRMANDLSETMIGLGYEKERTMAGLLYAEAEAYLYSNDIVNAKRLFSDCMDLIISESHDRDERYYNTLASLGECEESLGNFESAERLFIQAHDGIKTDYGELSYDYINSLNNLSEFYIGIGEFASAEGFANESLEILNSIKAPLTNLKYVTYFNTIQCGNHGPMVKNFDSLYIKALDIFDDMILKLGPTLSATQNQLLIKRKLPNFKKTFFSQLNHWSNKDEIVRRVYKTHLSTKGLNSSIHPSQLEGILHGDHKELYQEWKAVKLGIAKYHQANDQSKVDSLMDLTNEIEKMLPFKIGNKVTNTSLDNLHEAVGDSGVILDFFNTRTNLDSVQYGVFIIDSDNIVIKNLCIVNGNEDNFSELELIATNLVKDLRKNRNRVFIIPTGSMHSIGFSEIYINYPSIDLSILNTSLDVLDMKKEDKFISKSALLAGGLFYSNEDSIYQSSIVSASRNGDQVSYLPYSQKEIIKVQEHLENQNFDIDIFSGFNGSKTNYYRSVNNKQYGILHFATHGFYNEEDNKEFNFTSTLFNSGLILSAAKDSLTPDRLSSFEISISNLKSTSLVVLSACNSGKAKVVAGDDVYGLQRAFQAAGVDNMIITLDEVDDRATKYFMDNFYSHMSSGDQIASAYKEALVNLNQKYPDEVKKYKLIGLGNSQISKKKIPKWIFLVPFAFLFVTLFFYNRMSTK